MKAWFLASCILFFGFAVGAADEIATTEDLARVLLSSIKSGWINDLTEGAGKVIREARLVDDPQGDLYRLIVAGGRTFEFERNSVEFMRVRHPDGPWLLDAVVLMSADMHWVANFVFRTNGALSHEVSTKYNGKLKSLPRVQVAILDLTQGKTETMADRMSYFGMFPTEDQDDVMEPFVGHLTGRGSRSITFASEVQDTCRDLVKEHKISIPKGYR